MSQKCTHKLKVHVQLFLAVLAYTNCHPLQDCEMFLVLSLLHPGCQQKFFLLSSEHIYDLPLLPNADPHFILVCLSVPLHDAVLSLQPLQLGCCQLIHLGVIRAAYSEWEGHGGVWDGFVLE